MPRPIWKGYISFGLVNIPVTLYSAENKSDIRFRLIDSRNKGKIHYERINDETGKEVPWENVVKGYEYDDNEYVLIKEEDLKKIAGENSKIINIESFVDKSNLESVDFDKPYYLVPDKNGEKGYVILREALKNTKKIGITKVIIHTREYLAALMPYKNALILNLLRYHHEIKQPSEFKLPSENTKEYKITPKELEIAKQLIASMTTKWKPNNYQDEYRVALQKWIDEHMHKEKPHAKMKQKTTGPVRKTNVVNFVDLLKKSLAGTKKGKSTARKRQKQSHRHPVRVH